MANNVGSPQVSYRINGGPWVVVDNGSSKTADVTSGNSIQFQIIGNVADAATITIRNSSDGNVVLDTVVGTSTQPQDITPSAVDWTNFNDVSNFQSISNFTRALDIELSVVNSVGAPTVEYVPNSFGVDFAHARTYPCSLIGTTVHQTGNSPSPITCAGTLTGHQRVCACF